MNQHNFDRMIEFLMSDERIKYENPDDFLPRFLKRGDVVADIGCGPGFYCIRLIKLASKVFCVDKNERMLDYARKNYKRENMEFLNSTKLIPDASVDLVLMANSFHDMENKEEIHEEIRRISKSYSELLIVDWKKDEKVTKGPPYWLRMSEDEYIRTFSDFSLKEKFEVGPYHYGLFFVRRF